MKTEALKVWCDNEKLDFTVLHNKLAFQHKFNNRLKEELDTLNERGYAMFNLTAEKSTIVVWLKDKATTGSNHLCYHICF